MAKLSISFTLGKASQPNTVNLKHNNREFIAKNIDGKRTSQNIKFKSENVEDVYHKLFDDALDDFNSKQTRKDRKINNYYQYIINRNNIDPFYEVIVQFGDKDTASCDSETGKICKEMLCEYAKEFQKRNPNLYVFNSVLHMDEATPHLHIDFIPYYTQDKKIGMSKGVSMSAALAEQGYDATSKNDNRVLKFGQTERAEMEKILKKNGMERDDKKAFYEHMTVDEFKSHKDKEDTKLILNQAFKLDKTNVNQAVMQLELHNEKNKVAKLEKQIQSPYVMFFYSDSDKQSFVQAELDKRGIEYREVENGFESKEIFLQEIRKIEKDYVPEKTTYRDTLRDLVDRYVMQVKDFNELLELLRKADYEIKNGKYVAVKPKGSKQFIRLKSLGELYSEQALKNRIQQRQDYEQKVDNQIKESQTSDTATQIETTIIQTTAIYFSAFVKYDLPMRKKHQGQPFSWENDAELDALGQLHMKVKQGATVDSLRMECADAEMKVTNAESQLTEKRKRVEMSKGILHCAKIIYGNMECTSNDYDVAKNVMAIHPEITKDNYNELSIMIEDIRNQCVELEKKLDDARSERKEKTNELETIQKIMGGTYIQQIIQDEQIRKAADYIPNGLPTGFYR